MQHSLKALFYRLLKKLAILHMGPWSTSYDPRELRFAKHVKKTLDKWKRHLFLLNIFEIDITRVYERGYFSCIPRIHLIFDQRALSRYQDNSFYRVFLRTLFGSSKPPFELIPTELLWQKQTSNCDL